MRIKTRDNTRIDNKKFELPIVSEEFIEENQRFSKITTHSSKKGGPYNKKERALRRQEIYRLHFERGYPAIKIADFMKINRNTINSDIRFWYSVLAKDWKDVDIYAYIMKQFHRLDTQRIRLLDDLDKEENPSNKISIERLIFEIDGRLAQLLLKVENKSDAIKTEAHRIVNSWADELKWDYKAIDRWELMQVPAKKYDRIMRILKDE